MKRIEDFEITDHGIEHSQYFQGAGVAFTKWDACYTGIGDSPGEALDDAIEMLAQGDEYDHASLPDGWDEGILALTDDRITPIIRANCKCTECKPACIGECDCSEESELHYHVTIYVK